MNNIVECKIVFMLNRQSVLYFFLKHLLVYNIFGFFLREAVLPDHHESLRVNSQPIVGHGRNNYSLSPLLPLSKAVLALFLTVMAKRTLTGNVSRLN